MPQPQSLYVKPYLDQCSLDYLCNANESNLDHQGIALNGPSTPGSETSIMNVATTPSPQQHKILSRNTLLHPSLHLLQSGLNLPPKQPKPTPNNNAIANHISYLIELLSDLMSTEEGLKDPRLWKHIGPSLHSHVDSDPFDPSSSVVKPDIAATLSATWREMLKHMPNYRTHVVETVVEVYANGQKAKAWSLKKLCGLPGGFSKEQVSSTVWERQRDDTWVCVSINLLRGVSAYD